MTADERGLLAIRDRPDDDVPSLVYADWLDDRGRSEQAEFVRLQVAMAERERIRTALGPKRHRPPPRPRSTTACWNSSAALGSQPPSPGSTRTGW